MGAWSTSSSDTSPGSHRSDLLRGLLRLEQASEGTDRGAEVRYLGSTIVLRDEACFCQFEGPSSDAVAEVNRQAGLPFDRIVAAVTVNPKGAEMSTSVHPRDRRDQARSPHRPGRRGRSAGGSRHLGRRRVRVRRRQLATTAATRRRPWLQAATSPRTLLRRRSVGRPGLHVRRSAPARTRRGAPSIMSLTPAGSRRRTRSAPATPSRPRRAARAWRRSSPR